MRETHKFLLAMLRIRFKDDDIHLGYAISRANKWMSKLNNGFYFEISEEMKESGKKALKEEIMKLNKIYSEFYE
jgi:hypothetical protein